MSDLDVEKIKSIVAEIKVVVDKDYYLHNNEDVAIDGIDPINHFILSGINEGRAPSASSDADSVRQFIASTLGRIPDKEDYEEIYRYNRNGRSLRNLIVSKTNQLSLRIKSRLTNSKTITSAIRPNDLALKLCNIHACNALSSSPHKFYSKEEAVSYIIHQGWQTLDPLDFHLQPDLTFYRNLYDLQDESSDQELYKLWLDKDISNGRFISEAHMLRYYGAHTTLISQHFPFENYSSCNPSIPSDWNKEKILHHFMQKGIFDNRFNYSNYPAIANLAENIILKTEKTDPAKAVEAAENFILSEAKSDRLMFLIAKHNLDLGRLLYVEKLLNNYKCELPSEQFDMERLRAELAFKKGHIDRSVLHLSNARKLYPENTWTEAKNFTFLENWYESKCREAASFIKKEKVSKALEMIDEAIPKTYAHLHVYPSVHNDAVTFKRSDIRDIRVGILADLFLPQCKLYRVEQKVEQLEKANIHCRVYDFRTQVEDAFNDIGNYDAWIIYRTPALFSVLKVVRAANDLGLPTIYEIDDFLFDPEYYPEPRSTFDDTISVEQYQSLLTTPAFIGGLARLCKFGIASTPTLATELARYVRSGFVHVHRNALSDPHFNAIETARKQDREDRDRVKVFYGSGTLAHKNYFRDTFLPALDVILKKYDNVDFHSIGFVQSKELSTKYPGRIYEREPEWDIDKYWAALSTVDINVAVLKKSLLTDCKSEIKWIEAGMFGIPSIVSGTSTMTEIIENGKDGFIASSQQDWIDTLSQLCENKNLRNNVGRYAQTKILSEYSLRRSAESLKHFLDNVITPTANSTTEYG